MNPISPDAPDEGADRALEDALRRSRGLEDAPEALVQRVLALFEPRARAAAAAAPSPGLRRRLLAVLSFDSAGAAALQFGLRSTGATERQCLYSIEGRDIDLRIVASGPGRWRIAGQVLGPDAAGEAVLGGPGGERIAPWSELAEFGFDDVSAGTWVLVLRGADWEVELPAIELPAAAAGSP